MNAGKAKMLRKIARRNAPNVGMGVGLYYKRLKKVWKGLTLHDKKKLKMV